MPDRRLSLVATLLVVLPALALALAAAVTPARAATSDELRLAAPVRVGPPESETPGIVNGQLVTQAAYDSRWRAIVAIYDKVGFLCGGTLIDPRTVVTAAHCMRANGTTHPASDYTVVVGRRDLASSDGEALAVERVDVHPGYDAQLVRNDIATMLLARAPSVPVATVEPLAWTDTIWPNLGAGWSVGSDLVGPWIAGWGVADPQVQQLQDELREVKLPVHSDAQCASATAPGLGWQFDAGSMICAGVAGNGTVSGGGVDACQGDSGGPLLVGDGAGTWRLVGITSWGTGCAQQRWAAWTRVGAYTEWLDQHRFAPPTRPDPGAVPQGGGGGGAGGGAAPAGTPASGDVTPPSAPTALAASSITASGLTLRWASSTDDRGVAFYDVQWYTGSAWMHVSNEVATTVSMRAMTPGGLYRFRVRALDAAGNASPWSTVLGVRLLADPIRPTRPGMPRFSSITATSALLSWRASTDNVQLRRYVVQRLVGTRWMVAARPSRARVSMVGLPAHQRVTFRVQGVDTAGNRSVASPASTVRLR